MREWIPLISEDLFLFGGGIKQYNLDTIKHCSQNKLRTTLNKSLYVVFMSLPCRKVYAIISKYCRRLSPSCPTLITVNATRVNNAMNK